MDVGTKETAPLVVGKAALELPACQRMQLAILVDRNLNSCQKPLGLQPRNMFLEIQGSILLSCSHGIDAPKIACQAYTPPAREICRYLHSRKIQPNAKA
jgi:hypothetical protein